MRFGRVGVASELVTCGIVRLEVLRGLKIPKVRQRISRFMDIMIDITPTPLRYWMPDLTWELYREGKALPCADIIIAACAMLSSVAVLTSDIHFRAIEELRAIAPHTEWFS